MGGPNGGAAGAPSTLSKKTVSLCPLKKEKNPISEFAHRRFSKREGKVQHSLLVYAAEI